MYGMSLKGEACGCQPGGDNTRTILSKVWKACPGEVDCDIINFVKALGDDESSIICRGFGVKSEN